MDKNLLIGFLAASIRIASPLVTAAMGGIISECAGVFAIGLEGMMLFGAFAGAAAAYATGNIWLAILASIVGGVAIAWLLAVTTVSFRADQIVAAIAINILAVGLTSFLLRVQFGTSSEGSAKVANMASWPIPLLENIPMLGPVLFNHPPLTYLAYLLVPATAVLLYRTKWGLSVRAVGEMPKAAHVVGISPWRIRYGAVCFSGALAGLAGAILSLQLVGFFTDNMTQGRGYIALAAIIFGRWDPKKTAAACLLFGTTEALQLRVQAFGLPVSSYIVLMLPYVIAILALMVLGSKARHPTAINRPYIAAEN
jgi:simple sugar transport system permease protein